MSKKEICIYILKKILLFLASIFLLSVIVFYISRLAPGDPLVSYYGERVEKMSPEGEAGAERVCFRPVCKMAFECVSWRIRHLL